MPLTLDATTTDFVTLNEVKAHANVTDSRHDGELNLFRGAAQEAVEGMIGPVRHRTVVESFGKGGALVLKHHPVLSVDTVTTTGAATPTVSLDAGVVYVYTWYPVTVTYTVGRLVVPDSVRVAALIIAEHLWSTQRGTAPAATLQGDEGTPVPGSSYSIPNRATDLLRPFMLGPAVA